MEKYTVWILVALIAYVLFKDKLFGEGSVAGSFAAGTRSGPGYGPSPTGNTWANTPPGTVSPGPQPPAGKNFWDVVDTAIQTGGAAYDSYQVYK